MGAVSTGLQRVGVVLSKRIPDSSSTMKHPAVFGWHCFCLLNLIATTTLWRP